MATQAPYSHDPEFVFTISQKKIETTHNPFSGKRHFLFEVLRGKDNIYGIQSDLQILTSELAIEDVNQQKLLQLVNECDNADRTQKLLNYIYLQNNFYLLIILLYHRLPLVRKTAITLLQNGFEINPLVMSFFKSFFRKEDPIKTLVIPPEQRNYFIDFLNRDVVRWLTSLYLQTKEDKIWSRYSEKDIKLSIETQKKSADVFADTFAPEPANKVVNNQLIQSITDWLKTVAAARNTIIRDKNEINADKVYSLRNKWMQAESRIRTAHKFLERLIEKWDVSKETEFTKAFLMFLTGLAPHDRQIFFIYGSAFEDENIMEISFKYITELAPITNAVIFSSSKNAQAFVKAIVQAKYYGESNNKHPKFTQVCEHFNDLMVQLKEVEEVFVPSNQVTDAKFAIPLIEAPNAKVKSVTYQKGATNFKSFHFNIGKPKKKFTALEKTEPNSALQIQAISGIAIVLGEIKTRSSLLPTVLPEFEFKSRAAFKPCSIYEPRYSKLAKKSSKKTQTLEDIFGSNDEAAASNTNVTLEDILKLNNKDKNKES